MNNDLVSKEDIAREFEFAEKYVIVDDSRFDVNEIKKRIMRIPTVDAEPVRHGRWILLGRSFPTTDYTYTTSALYMCSECRLRATKKYPYCHCGAKMDAEARDVD